MNGLKLKSVMVLNGDTLKDLAYLLNRTEQTISAKIKGEQAEFTQQEISKIKEKYRLTGEDVDNIFFDQKVSYKTPKGK